MKKIKRGFYRYRGYIVHNIGYYDPTYNDAWEAYDEQTGEGIGVARTKADMKCIIDQLLEEEKKQ